MKDARRKTFRERHPAGTILWRRIYHLGLLGLALWLLGFLAFAAAIPAAVPEPERQTDAIVVLTGGGDRLATGFTLLERGLGRKLLITGVAEGVTLSDLVTTLDTKAVPLPSPEMLACCVSLGYAADNTVGNAQESAAWLKQEGFASIRLVTANYHMKRSLLEFGRVLPHIAIVPYPVFPPEVSDPLWFFNPRTILLLVNEYHKYLVALLRHWGSILPIPRNAGL